MGKLKRRRANKGVRSNPLSKKKNGGTDKLFEGGSTREQKVLPLIEKLTGTVPNDKALALRAIVVLCEDSKMRELFLKEKIISIVMEFCLNDSNDDVVVDAYGLLRNLIINEGYDVAIHVWRSNIWDSVISSTSRIATSFEYLDSALKNKENKGDKKKKQEKEAKVQLLYDFTENVLSLVTELAAVSEELLETILRNIEPLISLVVDILNWNCPTLRIPSALLNSLLEFIFEFSSESADFVHSLKSMPSFEVEKLELLNNSLLSTQTNSAASVYITGIKFHLNELSEGSDGLRFSQEAFESVIKVIRRIDLEQTASVLANDTNEESSDAAIVKGVNAKSTIIYNQSAQIDQAKSDFNAIEVGIDITTTIWEYISSIANNYDEAGIVEIQTMIVQVGFPTLLELLSFEVKSHGAIEVLEKVLMSFNNLCWLILSLNIIPVPIFELSLQLWNQVQDIALNSNDLLIQKNCLNVLWGIIKMNGEGLLPNLKITLVENVLNVSKTLDFSVPQNVSLQADYLLSSIGFLGSLAPIVGNTQVTETISEYLLATIEALVDNSSDPKLIESVLEALNLIYEIFGDKSYPYDYEIFVKKDYFSRISKLEPSFKRLYKSIDKNNSNYLKLRAEEAWINIDRFIKYKLSEQD